MELFRLRLNCIDHYQSSPSDLDPQLHRSSDNLQQRKAPKVPVIRVFGATETGQKVCAHIHGALPYLYIEYSGSLIQDEVDAYIHRLHLSIDHALAVSYRRNMYDGKTAFVARITLVKGVPFYGYHVGYQFFLKIYILNPMNMTRLADLLRQGTIMKKIIQPYESHMQYLAQWMCDYNLYGCGYVDCSKVKFRTPVPEYAEINSTLHQWHDRSIPQYLISVEDKFPRQSHCSLEIDICVQDILNRKDIEERPLHHDFIERTHPLATEEKLVHSMAGLWKDETRRRKARMPNADPGSSPFPAEVMISMSADSRNSQPGGWIHEEEYAEKIRAIVNDEKSQGDGYNMSFNGFVKKVSLESTVRTTLESVEDLFPNNLANLVVPNHAASMSRNDNKSHEDEAVEVDESRILSFDDNDFPYDSDEDTARELQESHSKQEDRIAEKHFKDTVVKAEYDEGSRPDEDNFDRQFRDPLDSARIAEPASSAELEALGVMKADNLDPMERHNYDKFDIPSAYVSDIGTTAPRQKRAGSDIRVESPNKKRRILHNEAKTATNKGGEKASGQVNVLARDEGEELSVPTSTVTHVNGNGDPHQLSAKDDSATFTEYKLQKTTFDPSIKGQGKNVSQECVKSNTVDGNKTLSFQVVKDPQDPETLRRLSQKSSSYQKSPKCLEGKHAFFESPIEKSSSQLVSSKVKSTSTTESDSQVSSQTFELAEQICSSFNVLNDIPVFCFAQSAPSCSVIAATMRTLGLPSAIYQDAFYGDEKDVPERAREYAGREFRLESSTVPYLPDFDSTGTSDVNAGDRQGIVIDRLKEEKAFQKRRRLCSLQTWEIGEKPPDSAEVRDWIEYEMAVQIPKRVLGQEHMNELVVVGQEKDSLPARALSQIDGPTQKNRHGFKFSQKQKSTSVQHEAQYMSIMSLEIHVNTRGNLVPNPEDDEIACVFWCIQSDDEDLERNGTLEGAHLGILALSEQGGLARGIGRQVAVDVEEESTELDLINRMVDIVRNHDPDILTGYEVHGGSWGYMIERARCKYDYNLCDEFSRMKSQSHGRFGKESDRWGFNHTSTIRVTGRHMINIWRAMRGELNLLQYTMENVAYHLLHRRIPHYTYHDLTTWYQSNKPKDLAKVICYYISRVQVDLEILEQNELVPRTSEQARLLGVDFFSVFSRGSQFKVESLMFRIAKPENFLLVSPSRKQVGQQNALECLPLVMEPQSAFYNSPLLVLDFQSLYPSVMIAYNYCYSTFLGRVVNWRGQNKMGFTEFKRQQRLLELLKDHINSVGCIVNKAAVAPNGIMYVKPEIRKSLLAKMLGEILETRVMVKSGMKVDKDDKTLQRLLNNRQLALKLIANVTYGYTSASFSGRMPCSEIADSIVQTGRETLEKAIALIHSVKKWGAEVVYGDTDSLFVYLKGRTKDEAFDIGNEIAKTITNMNPRPVKLKFEKVYFPCVLLAKKRYVGFKYESKNQKEPDFDAKGIETVRRDGTPAEQKIEEKALKILFRTADLSQVKKYFQRQCSKIMKGTVSIQDFCFAKEVKLGTYSDKGLPPPGALISTKRMLEDPRAEPQYGERVPYVVITGAPGARLIDRCVTPETLLQNDHNELDAEYYISKNLIPPLERIFNLVGANVRNWYDEMPKFQRIRRVENGLSAGNKHVINSKKTLESYMKSSSCIVCRDKLEAELPICNGCLQQPANSLLILRSNLLKAENKAVDLEKVCRSCAGLAWGEEVKCNSKDCPIFYTRTRHMASLGTTKVLLAPVMEVLEADDYVEGLEW
ncbi:MAG: DNA polymerase zeta [Pycnora praestabilis]|nr:MAG: DNA polymerase zeta [Pycnora praestabilis]